MPPLQTLRQPPTTNPTVISMIFDFSSHINEYLRRFMFDLSLLSDVILEISGVQHIEHIYVLNLQLVDGYIYLLACTTGNRTASAMFEKNNILA
jgi:hypothetical protein